MLTARLTKLTFVFLFFSCVTILGATDELRFGRDVRPVLAKHCFACHGPDDGSRKADLRLDVRSEALESGAIVPGKLDESEIILRIESDDEDLKMPPPSSHESISRDEIQILRSWVEQGAKYEKHWAFERPSKANVPKVKHDGWPITPLDYFVLDGIEKKGWDLAKEADRLTWLRRVSLDLTGLPPSLEQANQFLADGSDKAYENVVDQLLEDQAFGEHWARMWLDLARYADTRGYEKDRHRDIWRFRDWVIDAFNADKPFDQFTREQLAGDLLPDRTAEQVLATAFHRNTMTNEEGGTDNEEFRVAAVKDRVDTTIQVWMGLTMGCAKCHSHKYDPISLNDYYSFYAIFNQTQDNDTEGPYWPTPTRDQTRQIDNLQKQIAQKSLALKEHTPEFEKQLQVWKKQFEAQPLWQSLQLESFRSRKSVQLKQQENGILLASGERPEKDTWELEFDISLYPNLTSIRFDHFPKSEGGGEWPDANVAIQEIEVQLVDAEGKEKPLKLRNPRASFSQRGWEVNKAIDKNLKVGWAISPRFEKRQAAVFDFEKPVTGLRLKIRIVQEYGQGLLLARSKISVSRRSASWNLPDINVDLDSIFARHVFGPTKKLFQEIDQLNQELASVQKKIPQTPVMLELPESKWRETRIHNRGNFLDPTEKVSPRELELFGKLPEKAKRNRLEIANWLVAESNPLTARVMVNRVWARLFGIGLVETEEDFGTQGLLPSHPELLDWLAVDFREQGWSLKKLIRQIVLSRTYRQSSSATDDQLRNDPRNRWLTRGPRFRLPAETVRDQALAASGLLSRKIGGPSVMPPQPDGIWKSTYNGQAWKNAEGPDRYRRAIYTYLKRTSPYPAMQTFDAGSGEVCVIRRVRTNTPLQALVTLNDQAFWEAAGALSLRMKKASNSLREQLTHGFRRLLIRKPDEQEVDRLVKLYESLDLNEQEQKELLESAGLTAGDARMLVVANVLLNLDETVSKP